MRATTKEQDAFLGELRAHLKPLEALNRVALVAVATSVAEKHSMGGGAAMALASFETGQGIRRLLEALRVAKPHLDEDEAFMELLWMVQTLAKHHADGMAVERTIV